jgi:hypothetical protein
MVSAFNHIEEWDNKYRQLRPEWFNPAVKPLSFDQVVGTDAAPGALYSITVERFAAARVQMVRAAGARRAPAPLAPARTEGPSFEHTPPHERARGRSPATRARRLRSRPARAYRRRPSTRRLSANLKRRPHFCSTQLEKLDDRGGTAAAG